MIALMSGSVFFEIPCSSAFDARLRSPTFLTMDGILDGSGGGLEVHFPIRIRLLPFYNLDALRERIQPFARFLRTVCRIPPFL